MGSAWLLAILRHSKADVEASVDLSGVHSEATICEIVACTFIGRSVCRYKISRLTYRSQMTLMSGGIFIIHNMNLVKL